MAHTYALQMMCHGKEFKRRVARSVAVTVVAFNYYVPLLKGFM